MLQASNWSENRAGALVLVNPHVPKTGVGGLRRLHREDDGKLGRSRVRCDRVDEVLRVVDAADWRHSAATGYKEELICTLTLAERH